MARLERGDWAVIRQCCTSGFCERHNRGMPRTLGFPPVGKLVMCVVQMHGISEEAAQTVARNWSSYGAKAVPMASITFEGDRLLSVDGVAVGPPWWGKPAPKERA